MVGILGRNGGALKSAPYGAAEPPLQSDISGGLEAFHSPSGGEFWYFNTAALFACQNRLPQAWIGLKPRSKLNFLLCMFNAFAFAKPFCRPTKEIPNGG
jgi:hypothetical protein